jgi:hypothetical protein
MPKLWRVRVSASVKALEFGSSERQKQKERRRRRSRRIQRALKERSWRRRRRRKGRKRKGTEVLVDEVLKIFKKIRRERL